MRPVQWYFDNLLPEEELRRVAATDAGLKDQDDAFALLQYLGAEPAGSLSYQRIDRHYLELVDWAANMEKARAPAFPGSIAPSRPTRACGRSAGRHWRVTFGPTWGRGRARCRPARIASCPCRPRCS
jgi:hypothetical protein